jgi:signal transduction histidine kinase
VSIAGESATAIVRRTGRPARMEHYEGAEGPLAELARATGLRSSVATPIVVEGRVWGLITASWKRQESPPPDTEERMSKFAELLDTAIAGAEARAQRERLAHEQAALRRVATLVARESSPGEIFGAVAEEVARVLGTDGIGILRFEPDGAATLVAQSVTPWEPVPAGTRFDLDGQNVIASVLQTGKTARLDDWVTASGAVADNARSLGIRSSVAAPILVEGRLWGTMVAVTAQVEPLPADTESRIGEFTELVATAISNAEARTELAASRARLVAAADDERRRVVRDLHDGAQQRLVHAIITTKLACRALDSGDDAGPLLGEALAQVEQANTELRELAHGILPTVLVRGGLRAGVEALASRTPVPVDIGASVGRLPAAVEATAYFVIAEALTNVAKHSRAERAQVSARVEEGELRIQVRDDGVGGARPDGSGLVGLGDRIATVDGRFEVETPPGGGTLVTAHIPLPD